MAPRREDWKDEQPALDAGRRIFIEEQWAKTDMTRCRGRGPRGRRVIDETRHGHGKTASLIAGLSAGGVRCSMVVDGASNRGGLDGCARGHHGGC